MRRKSPWVRLVILLVAAAVVLSRGGMGRRPWRAVPTPIGFAFTGRCVEVSDGSTIRVMHDGRSEEVRLFGVDAPGIRQDYGQAAREFTTKMVLGKNVKVEIKDTDRYGRSFGWVTLDTGAVLNAELVRVGLAWWYNYSDPTDEQLADLQSQARKAKRGLWSMGNPTPPWDYRRDEARPGERQQ